ncbi:MAG: alkaline phosphatase family protein [Spirosomataceae bacterium]
MRVSTVVIIITIMTTVTAAGHASVYTGSAPAIHGIVGNDWYDQRLGKGMYCAGDSTVQTVGSSNVSAGKCPQKICS